MLRGDAIGFDSRIRGSGATALVSQYARAVARGTRVDCIFARSSTKSTWAPQKTLEVRRGEHRCPWICDFPSLGTSTKDGQAIVWFNRVMGSSFRINPHRLDCFILLDIPVESEATKAESLSRRHRSHAVTSFAIFGTNSQCANGEICGCRRDG